MIEFGDASIQRSKDHSTVAFLSNCQEDFVPLQEVNQIIQAHMLNSGMEFTYDLVTSKDLVTSATLNVNSLSAFNSKQLAYARVLEYLYY